MSAADLSLQQEVRTLYRDHHGWLSAYKLGIAFDAADLAQDVFMRLLTRASLRRFC